MPGHVAGGERDLMLKATGGCEQGGLPLDLHKQGLFPPKAFGNGAGVVYPPFFSY